MSRISITDRDIKQMLAITRPCDKDDGGDPMRWELLLGLAQLIDSEYI